MKAAGVKRLITVTGLGAGDSRGHGGFLYGAFLSKFAKHWFSPRRFAGKGTKA